jgi:UDP-N-acetyl-D-mannosaminuronic acid dehydrogenase
MEISTVGVIGLGYIGLPTAAILASKDVKVVGVDINPNTVAAVNRGDVPFVEPDLATYVAGAVTHGTLRASTTPEPADAFIIAVPTPFTGDFEPDLSYIRAAAEAVAPHLRGGELLILESTSPPGATEKMSQWVLAARPDLSLDGSQGRPVLYFAHCPERVLPGRIMIELVTNDRIVGGLTTEAAEAAKELYSVFCQGEILLTDAVTAEMAKLVENSFRDVNIAFANELSLIAERLGIDAWELIRLANHHPRVNILQPGPGVGGHCIAVDPWFIVDADPENARLIHTARQVNDGKPRRVVEKIGKTLESLDATTVAIFGLSYKPNVGDMRESPAVVVADQLSAQRTDVEFVVVDPFVDALPDPLSSRSNIHMVEAADAIAKADVVALLVAHDSYLDAVAEAALNINVIDVCGALQRVSRHQGVERSPGLASA